MNLPRIYCNNIDCKHNQKIEKEKYFSFNKINYIPFEDNKILGKCTRKGYDFISSDVETLKRTIKVAYCNVTDQEVIITPSDDS